VNKKVLVVDDNVDAGQTLTELLGLLEYEAEFAGSGPAALARVPVFRPVAILCDLAMPGMDGYEFATAVLARYGEAAPVLVAYTGFGSPADRKRSQAAGFRHHLTKPVALPDLLAVLEAVSGQER
jgi:CheY-like chemotaxis protein